MVNLTLYKAIVFDLDNTIYDEIEYLKLAYRWISHRIVLSDNTKLQNEIYDFLIDEFMKNGRKNLYQKLKNSKKIDDFNEFTLEDFLNGLRTCPINSNQIEIDPDIYRFIEYLHNNNKSIFILTNGNVEQQMNKVKSLNIPFKETIAISYASSKGIKYQKPNPYFLDKIISENSFINNEILYIGDSSIDNETAKNIGVDFLYVSDFKSQYREN